MLIFFKKHDSQNLLTFTSEMVDQVTQINIPVRYSKNWAKLIF